MAECCAEGFTHSGTPVGKVIKIGEFPTYYTPAVSTSSSSASSSSALIICTDVFGYELVNVRLVADKYAALGTFDVYIPDLHMNDSLRAETFDPIFLPPKGFFNSIKSGFKFAASLPTLLSWFSRHNDKISTPIVDKFMFALRTERPSLGKLGAIGYCWGGKFSVLMGGKLAKERTSTVKSNDSNNNNERILTPTVDCIVACHPSMLTVPADIENIIVPAFFGLAETDQIFPKKDVEATKTILRSKGTLRESATTDNSSSSSSSSSTSGGLEFVMIEYKGTKHGFAVRGSEEDSVVVNARNNVLHESHQFLVKHLT